MIETSQAILALWIASGMAGAIYLIDKKYEEFNHIELWFFGTGLFLGPFIFCIEAKNL